MKLSTVVEGTQAAGLTVVVGLVVIDPLAGLRAAPDWAGWVSGQQRLDRVMSRVAPVLFLTTALSTAAAVGVALAQRRPCTAAGRAAAAGCIAGAIGITLSRNEPVNRELRGWRATDEPPAGWRDARVRWERAHLVRRVLLAVAAGTAAAGPLLESLTGRQADDTLPPAIPARLEAAAASADPQVDTSIEEGLQVHQVRGAHVSHEKEAAG